MAELFKGLHDLAQMIKDLDALHTLALMVVAVAAALIVPSPIHGLIMRLFQRRQDPMNERPKSKRAKRE